MNRNPDEQIVCAVRLEGFSPTRVRRAILGADSVDAADSSEHPDAVKVRRSSRELPSRPAEEAFAPHSYTVLDYEA